MVPVAHRFCIILCGLPASGKSTFAKHLVDDFQLNDTAKNPTIVDIDLLREKMYSSSASESNFKPEQEKHLREEKINKISRILESGTTVIDDDLNYFRSMRRETVTTCAEHGTFYAIIHVATPVNVCLDWNKGRPEPVSEEVILRINEKFDPPGSRDYLWDQPLRTVEPNVKNIEILARKTRSTIMNKFSFFEEKRGILEASTELLDDLGKLSLFNLANLEKSVQDVNSWRRQHQDPETPSKRKESPAQRFDIAARGILHEFIQEHGPLQEQELEAANRIKKDGIMKVKTLPESSAECLGKLRRYLESLRK